MLENYFQNLLGQMINVVFPLSEKTQTLGNELRKNVNEWRRMNMVSTFFHPIFDLTIFTSEIFQPLIFRTLKKSTTYRLIIIYHFSKFPTFHGSSPNIKGWVLIRIILTFLTKLTTTFYQEWIWKNTSFLRSQKRFNASWRNTAIASILSLSPLLIESPKSTNWTSLIRLSACWKSLSFVYIIILTLGHQHVDQY